MEGTIDIGSEDQKIKHKTTINLDPSQMEVALKEKVGSRKFISGLNVRSGSQITSEEILQKAVALSPEELSRQAQEKGINVENANQTDLPTELRELLLKPVAQELAVAATEQGLAWQKKELELTSELGAQYLRVHMDLGPQRLSHIITASGSISQEGMANMDALFNLEEENQKRKGKLEIGLGPGLQQFKREDGTIVTNQTNALVEANGRVSYTNELVPTEFHIPTEKEEITTFCEYAELIYGMFPRAYLTVWNEPNFNLADHHIKFEKDGGKFSSNGRNAQEYGRLVLEIGKRLDSYRNGLPKGVRNLVPQAQLGMDAVFVDTDFLVEAMQVSDEAGKKAGDYLTHVSVHPYRDRPEDSGPKWSNDLSNAHSDRSGNFDFAHTQSSKTTYEEEILDLYERVGKINPNIAITAGEAGWPLDKCKDEEQQAAFTAQSLIQNKILGLPTANWQLSPTDERYSLVSPEGKKRETFQTLAVFNRILAREKVDYLGSFPSNEAGVRCEAFDDPKNKGVILALWSTDGKDHPVDFNLPQEIATSITGDTVLIPANQPAVNSTSELARLEVENGKFTTVANEMPAYIFIPRAKA